MNFTKKIKAKIYCLNPNLYKNQIVTGYLQSNEELLVNGVLYRKSEWEQKYEKKEK